MNALWTETGYVSINKFGEQLCGDCVEIINESENTTTLVLADGLGSGVKANILSTLTSKILCTMISSDMAIEDCVETIASTLPICKKRKIAYSTFSIIRVKDNREVQLIQYDNPMVIVLRNGKNYDYPKNRRIISGKIIFESKFPIQLDDVIIAMSDGAVYAGVGRTLNFGWQRENIIEYLESKYKNDFSAKLIASLLVDECNQLYDGKPGDDTTVAAVRIRKRQPVNLLIGPPANREDDEKVMNLFFGKEGTKIICGGTTANIASRYLKSPIYGGLDYVDPNIPPISHIEGVDLVTEGVVTISRVLQYAKDYLDGYDLFASWNNKKDGASLIAKQLFENATDIIFFVGKAINPAHQNPDLPINFAIKISLIEELAKCLNEMGKQIKISYF